MKKLFIISGSSGSGKSSVVKGLLHKLPELELSVSCTTRAPRSREKNGADYYFITKEEFKKRIKNDGFLEYAIVHSDNFYGTLKSEIDRIVKLGKVPLLEIDVQGANILSSKFDFVTTIFIKPESIEELIRRIRKRGTVSEEELSKRLKSIKLENEESEKYDFTVINKRGEIKNTIKKVAEYIKTLLRGNVNSAKS